MLPPPGAHPGDPQPLIPLKEGRSIKFHKCSWCYCSKHLTAVDLKRRKVYSAPSAGGFRPLLGDSVAVGWIERQLGDSGGGSCSPNRGWETKPKEGSQYPLPKHFLPPSPIFVLALLPSIAPSPTQGPLGDTANPNHSDRGHHFPYG